MLRKVLSLLVAVLTVAASPMAGADTLIIEGLQAAQSSQNLRPRSGLSMSAVSAKWGEPRMRRAAVGDPPITRWDYDGFAVFFEYQHVIHAVRLN